MGVASEPARWAHLGPGASQGRGLGGWAGQGRGLGGAGPSGRRRGSGGGAWIRANETRRRSQNLRRRVRRARKRKEGDLPRRSGRRRAARTLSRAAAAASPELPALGRATLPPAWLPQTWPRLRRVPVPTAGPEEASTRLRPPVGPPLRSCHWTAAVTGVEAAGCPLDQSAGAGRD